MASVVAVTSLLGLRFCYPQPPVASISILRTAKIGEVPTDSAPATDISIASKLGDFWVPESAWAVSADPEAKDHAPAWIALLIFCSAWFIRTLPA